MKNLLIFGAGNIGKWVYNECILARNNDNYDNVFFYDNDRKKQNTYLQGVLVLTYEKLLEILNMQECEIVIATDYWKELISFCRKLNIEDKIVDIRHSLCFNFNPYVRHIYGQDAEEMYLIEKMEEMYGSSYQGFYVDIGAHHPYRFSNTHWAYMRGWKGINVEPNADAIELFDKARVRDININCGISNEEIIMKYYKFEEPAFNTFDMNEFENFRTPKEVVDIPVKTLKSVLKEHGIEKVDFMNIDVEGLEMQVLESNNWEKVKPTFILIEQKNISVSELVESELYAYLKGKGYECEWKGIRTAIYKLV